nr:acyltransferase [uncultured Dyadobacter sp.]
MKQRIKEIVKNSSLLYLIGKKIQKRFAHRSNISGSNNIISNKGVLLDVKYDIVGNNNLVHIMQDSILSDVTIRMRGDNHQLVIGENCRFLGGSVWFANSGCQIQIGQNTTIESAHLAATEPNRTITIGEDCMLAYGIEFRTGDSHSIIDNDTRKRINWPKDIVVGDHVWIAAHAIVLKGSSIGNNSVIGTNSVVTSNIPNNSIAVGIPAKVIKSNIDWTRELILNE